MGSVNPDSVQYSQNLGTVLTCCNVDKKKAFTVGFYPTYLACLMIDASVNCICVQLLHNIRHPPAIAVFSSKLEV